MRMPEEVNRILTDRVSSIMFCPTKTAIENLEREGVNSWQTQVSLSGDVMQDGALFYRGLAKKPSFETQDDFVLCTIHRAENTDDAQRLTNIVEALNEVALTKSVVLPLHPRTKNMLANLSVTLSKNIKLVDPVGYLNMVWLIDNCSLVMTDSGGLQKEAFFFAKPCITLRDETEWVELIEHNFNVLVGADKVKILSAFKNHHFSSDFGLDLYGGGFASKNIIEDLINYG
jgi:UDP-GlcNAc3NAcA epimerase